MRMRASIFPARKWKTFLFIAAVASMLLFHFSPSPAPANDTPKEKIVSEAKPAEAQPAPSHGAPKPQAEPAPSEKAAPAEPAAPAQPAEKPAEPKSPPEPEAKPEPVKAEKQEAAAKPEPPKEQVAGPKETKPEEAQPVEPAKPATPAAKPEEKRLADKPAEPQVKEEEPAKEAEEEEAETAELTNESCMDCHTADILDWSKEDRQDNVVVDEKGPQPPKKKPVYVFGEVKLAIDIEKFKAGVHAETACVECHNDIEELPHKQRLKSVECADCHDDAVEAVNAGPHGEKAGEKAPTCIGCHDAHYGKAPAASAEDWNKKYCLDCHKANGLDTVAAHKSLYEPELHMAHGCLICHQGEERGVHNIVSAKTKTASCQACHNKYTALSTEKPVPVAITYTGFINEKVRKAYGYLVGAHRIPLLDLIVILAVLGPLALPIFHGGGRILTRRKEPLKLPEEKVLLHPAFERGWHWFQAVCIVMLIITGIVLHWPEKFSVGAFQWAVDWHNIFGWCAVIAWLAWFAYNIGSGRIKHYIPRSGDIPTGMIKQARFYGYGIFKHEPHPYAPSEDNKFNPLQKIAYLKFQLLLFPLLLISGLLYMYPETFKGIIDAIGGMTVLAIIHYILAALFAAFLMAHLYLATTGETIGENFKAIITGYGVKTDDHHHA